MANLIESTSLWCDGGPSGTSDKVYSIQLLQADDGKHFQVDTQYGKRDKVCSGDPQGRSFKQANGKDAETTADSLLSKWEAENVYNTLLRKKRDKGYDKKVPTIYPAEYGTASAVFVSKEELSKVAENVKGLLDFLSTKGIKQVEKEDTLASMLKSME